MYITIACCFHLCHSFALKPTAIFALQYSKSSFTCLTCRHPIDVLQFSALEETKRFGILGGLLLKTAQHSLATIIRVPPMTLPHSVPGFLFCIIFRYIANALWRSGKLMKIAYLALSATRYRYIKVQVSAWLSTSVSIDHWIFCSKAVLRGGAFLYMYSA